MPLALRPPRPGKTPNYEIRGTYLGVRVEQSAGTDERKIALQQLKRLKRQIERGEFPGQFAGPAPDQANHQVVTFAMAAEAYLLAGGAPQYLGRILELAGERSIRHRPIADIDQIAIDNACAALYPDAPATTRNRQFYTPVSAVMKHAGEARKIRRPKGWRGSRATSWLEPDAAFALIDQAYVIEPEFGLFCETLLYTGMRLSDPLRARLRDLRLSQGLLYLPDTKNGEPRPVHLPPVLVRSFRAQPARMGRPRRGVGKPTDRPLVNGAAGRSRASAGVAFLDRPADDKLFRFHNGGRLRKILALAIARAGLTFPKRQGGFHLFCHTYGTWMKRYGNLDTYGLTRTGRWKDPDSADRYNHTAASFEARQADKMPVYPRKRRRRSGE